jgi:ankyrin repeat protein/beta-lactamase regulating signal transducer with metallopeptidase domain
MDAYLNEVVRYLFAQSWQITVLTAAVAVVTFALRYRSAHIRYLLWLLVLAKCLVPPLHAVPLRVLPQTMPEAISSLWSPPAEDWEHPLLSEEAPLGPPSSPQPAPAPPAAAPAHRVQRPSASHWLGIAWVVGAGAYLLLNLLRALRGHCWIRNNRRPLPAQVQAETENLLQAYDTRRTPPLWMIEGVGQPFVWGLVRGSIYVPPGFLTVESQEHRRDILAHELGHVLRYDAAVNTLQVIAQGLFWFHPLVWWANKKIRQEREKVCDEMAVARLGSRPREYSTAIISTLIQAQESTRRVPSLAVAGPVKNLEERIKTMLTPGRKFYQRPSLMTASIVFLAALVTVPTALVLTARAQTEPPKAKTNSPQTLHQAAAAGDVEQVQKLLAQGADVHAKDENGRTPLHSAARQARKDVVEVLLARGANVNEVDGSGQTPLHLAANFGWKPVPELLLAHGAQIDARDKAGNTPLHAAADQVNVEKDLLEFLIAKGADVKARNEAGQTPLHRVSMIGRLDRHLERTAEVLLALGAEIDAKDPSGRTPLHFAVGTGHRELVDLLVAKGADVKTRAADGMNLLHQAVRSGQIAMVERILSMGIDIDSARSDGRTALHLALATNKFEYNSSIVEALIARGADVKARDVRGNTPAQIAVVYNKKNAVRLLLDKGAEVSTIQIAAYLGDLDAVKAFLGRGGDVNAPDGDLLLSPLQAAAQGGHKDVAAFLIDQGASVNAEQERGMTALHFAMWGGSKEVVELLIANGAKVDAKAQGAGTPLRGAVRMGAKDIVSLLIDHGADVNAEVEIGTQRLRPLDYAVYDGHKDVARLLIDKGADTSRPDVLLFRACTHVDKDLAELVIRKGANVNSQAWGYAPALEAVWSGYTKATKPADVPRLLGVLEVLLDHGADPDAKDRYDWSLLHYACGNVDLTKLLLDRGANPNVATPRGLTPLHFVADGGDKAVTQLLLGRGADVHAKDVDGHTPLSCAEDVDNDAWGNPRKTHLTAEAKAARKEVARILRQHGAKE